MRTVCRCTDVFVHFVFFFFKQKTAYEMRISDWSSDVCSSDLVAHHQKARHIHAKIARNADMLLGHIRLGAMGRHPDRTHAKIIRAAQLLDGRSEEHTSELQSLMRISYAVFCLKKKHQTVTNIQ